MKKILVPIDGSEGSNLAIDKARDLAKMFESEVILIHVSDSSSSLFTEKDEQSGNSSGQSGNSSVQSGSSPGMVSGAGMGVGAGMGAGMGSSGTGVGMGAGGAAGIGLVGAQDTNQTNQPGQNGSNSAEKILESGKERCTVLGDKVSVVELEGKTAESIIDYIDTDKDIDLVIMGSTGMSDFKRFFVGSVTQKVTESIDRSIMIVK